MSATPAELSKKTVLLLAIATGVIVANLNYIQPIEGLIATSFAISKATVGLIATLTQLGYALGLLLIVPLGDIFDRYHLIQLMMVLSIGALLVAFWSPTVVIFGIASTLIGVTSVAAQVIVPYAAYLAPGVHQGRILGNVLSGLLTGILLSRSFSGLLGSILAWQDVYVIAAGLNLILLVILHRYLPRDPRGYQRRNYLKVLASLPHLLRSQRHLQGSALNGFCLFGVSNILWSTLAFYLASQYHWGSSIAGLLGLLGITGVLFAPIIGQLVDKYSPRLTIGLSWLFSALAFGIFWLTGHLFSGLIVGIVLLDLGTQFSQVSNQAIVQSLNREASSRNNSVFMFSYFLGGSLGTFFSTWAWSHYGWNGVCSVAVVFLAIALIGQLALRAPQKLHRLN
ncbi:MFS transporter [Loigolactobacillus binensis]|uniref:MFS transporter n=1 Tax=Loigolactobacillus binensis TaxID=2559922 RepID=A0ABW3EC50_9LACO|nr:MFS transporter [Loigolactobacillus binensis]